MRILMYLGQPRHEQYINNVACHLGRRSTGLLEERGEASENLKGEGFGF
jgi:hypothetical protein